MENIRTYKHFSEKIISFTSQVLQGIPAPKFKEYWSILSNVTEWSYDSFHILEDFIL